MAKQMAEEEEELGLGMPVAKKEKKKKEKKEEKKRKKEVADVSLRLCFASVLSQFSSGLSSPAACAVLALRPSSCRKATLYSGAVLILGGLRFTVYGLRFRVRRFESRSPPLLLPASPDPQSVRGLVRV